MKSKSQKILLVEDHEDSANAMSRIIAHLGYQVVVADSCAAAMRIFIANTFDVLLLDISLPDGDGFELLKQLNAIKKVPAIAMTGVGIEEIEKSKDAGFLRYVQKPLQINDLQDALNAVA